MIIRHIVIIIPLTPATKIKKRKCIKCMKVPRNRPFSYSTKEPGSSDIFIHFYTRGSIEWR